MMYKKDSKIHKEKDRTGQGIGEKKKSSKSL